MAEGSYYGKDHLAEFPARITRANKDLAGRFFEYYGSVMGPGALTEREKALIGLAVSHAVQCPYCIETYTKSCLAKGADASQMTEAVHVAAAVSAGSVLVHGMQMFDRVEKSG